MTVITVKKAGANALLLHQQMKAVLGDTLIGMGTFDDHIDVTLAEDAAPEDEQTVNAIIDAHDGTQKADAQIVADAADKARQHFRDTLEAQIDWHEANPATAANAVLVLQHLQTEWVVLLKKMRVD